MVANPPNVDAHQLVGNDSPVVALPFAHTHRRLFWLRATLLLASLLGLIASAPVWSNTRTFPLLSICSWFPVLPSPLDQLLYAFMLLSLVTALWFYRTSIIAFLVCSLYAYCSDQNRGQPWLYMYWFLLLLSLFPVQVALAAGRVSIAVVYLWGGIQKLNPRFFTVTPEWFVAPAADRWHLPMMAVDALKLSVKAAPFIEIAIAILLWFPKLRRTAFGLTIVTHGFALLFLGPWGHNYNWVVWPWNLAMIALVLVLFSRGNLVSSGGSALIVAATKPRHAEPNPPTRAEPATTLQETARALLKSKTASALVVLYGILPVLSYSGRWDSYFSFSLYSENLAVANIFCTERFKTNLPPRLQKYAEPFNQVYDPIHQGPSTFSFTAWAYEELHVPAISEPRNFQNVYQQLSQYAPTPADLRMIISPRGGPIIFREGNKTQYLQRLN